MNAEVDFKMLFNENSNFIEDEIIVLDNLTYRAKTYTKLIESKKSIYIEMDFKRMNKKLNIEKNCKIISNKEIDLIEHL